MFRFTTTGSANCLLQPNGGDEMYEAPWRLKHQQRMQIDEYHAAVAAAAAAAAATAAAAARREEEEKKEDTAAAADATPKKLGRPQKVPGCYSRDTYDPVTYNQRGKMYYAANKDKVLEYQTKNKETIAKQQHAYYIIRCAQKKLREPAAVVNVECECGRTVSLAGLKNHQTTKLHAKHMALKTE